MSVPTKGNKMISYVGQTLTVTLGDGRTMVGQLLAFDKFMNLVLTETEETRPWGRSGPMKRQLGLVLLRGEQVVSIRAEKKAAVVGDDVAPGTGSAIPSQARTVTDAPVLPGSKKSFVS